MSGTSPNGSSAVASAAAKHHDLETAINQVLWCCQFSSFAKFASFKKMIFLSFEIKFLLHSSGMIALDFQNYVDARYF